MAKTLVYQMYPISWEKQGGLVAMTEHLKRVKALDADYVWLSPLFPSPRHDGGYDISDFLNVDGQIGTLDELDDFIQTAHRYDIGVLFDLTLNHTSTEHEWFEKHPEYYCWSKSERGDWKNLFDQGSCWTFVPEKEQYYLHLFHKNQADLNWFPGGELNQALVHEFRDIVKYWKDFDIDGFRLDIPQAINKDFKRRTLELSDLLFGDQAIDVINAVFNGYDDLFLIMECIDPTHGELIDYYANSTPVDFVLNTLIKDEIRTAPHEDKDNRVMDAVINPNLMLDLESHDSPRMVSDDIPWSDVIWWMFSTGAEGLCLYQGQELGLKNPGKRKMPNKKMLSLDAQTAMRYYKGEDLDELRPLSRANARIPIPLDEYEFQEHSDKSCLALTRAWVKKWRNI